MRALLLVTAASLAAIALPVTSAQAEGGSKRGITFVSGGSPHHGGVGHRDGRRHRGDDDSVFAYDYYREYQGDTVWRSDSFNDWWHDRPDRAYPAWVRNNQNCERKWWGGESLRC